MNHSCVLSKNNIEENNNSQTRSGMEVIIQEYNLQNLSNFGLLITSNNAKLAIKKPKPKLAMEINEL
jgi:hypothetical protein